MFINILTFLVILLLIFVNGITDASNSVSSVVGTKVLSYRKACVYSGIFNIIGIISMYVINSSVTNTVLDIITLPSGRTGITVILVSMVVTIFFSILSLLKGVPASESYGLIFSLLGASFAVSGISNINLAKINTIIISLLFSIIGSVVITRIVNMCIKRYLCKTNVNKIKTMQIISSLGMSFAHGAQDGLKFIGVLKMFEKIIMPSSSFKSDILLVIVCALTLSIGTMIGGKRIITTVGEKITKLDNRKALISEISTVITLMLGSFNGLPLSTSHVKTMSTVSSGSIKDVNVSKIKDMLLTWFLVLPLCMLLSYFLMNL